MYMYTKHIYSELVYIHVFTS